jgi:hypothetical protein
MDITALEVLRVDELVLGPALDARGLRPRCNGDFVRSLNRPAMAFRECYEFLEVVLPFARPQETVRPKEVHVSDLHQLHGWRPEASRNKGEAYSGGDQSQCPVDLSGFVYNSYLDAARDKCIARILEPIAAWPDDERFVVEISNSHFFSLREAMIYWNGQNIGFLEENPTLEFEGVVIDNG